MFTCSIRSCTRIALLEERGGALYMRGGGTLGVAASVSYCTTNLPAALGCFSPKSYSALRCASTSWALTSGSATAFSLPKSAGPRKQSVGACELRGEEKTVAHRAALTVARNQPRLGARALADEDGQ